MKVVLDTNVIIAAFASNGLCHLVFEYCLENCVIVISQEILNEIKTAALKKLKIPASAATHLASFIAEVCQHGMVTSIPHTAKCRDPRDAHILNVALSESVEYIVTGDDDLLSLRTIAAIPILSPRGFWEKIKK